MRQFDVASWSPVYAIQTAKVPLVLLAMLIAGCQQMGTPSRSLSITATPSAAPVVSKPVVAAPTNSTLAESLTVRGVADDNDQPSDPGESIFSADDSRYRINPQSGNGYLQPSFARGFATPIDGSDDPSPFGHAAEDEGAPFAPKVEGVGEPIAEEPLAGGSDSGPFNVDDPTEISFREDLKQLPRMLWDDNLSLYNWRNAIILGVAGGGAVAVRDNLDQPVRNYTAEHPLRWGEGSVVLRQFGEYTVQVPALATVYAVSLWTDDDKLHEFSKAVISAYSLSAMYTVALKGITNTSRPTTEFENGHYGFPSYHASSTFSIAAVVDEYYGWQVALPVYTLAGLVGWSRIDQREHDLSDVLFGSVLGFVVGKTVAAAHLDKYSNFRVTPYYDAINHGGGVTVEKKF